IYPLWGEADMPEDAVPPNQINCPRCKRPITSDTVSVGSRQKCPHCEMDFVVSRDMLSSVYDVAADDDLYDLKIEEAAPTPVVHMPFRESVVEAEEDIEEEEALSWRPDRPMPRNLFTSKTFLAPLAKGFRMCIVSLMIGSLILGLTISSMIFYFSKTEITSGRYMGSSLDNFNPWFFGFVCLMGSFLFGIPYAVVSATIGMSLFRDTYEGFDSFVSWPRDWYATFIRDASYVLISMFWAGLPIFVLTSLLPGVAWWRMPLIIIAELMFFPVFFFSALVSNSPVMLHSTLVWNSVRFAWQAWKRFYLLTISGGVAFAGLLKLLGLQSVYAEILVFFAIFPFALIVYSRLLGRLAWYCSGRFDEMELQLETEDSLEDETG
ncbi:MAG: hypothetical protein ACWGMZ_06450, partial [Thermoguttaceae bacterium]